MTFLQNLPSLKDTVSGFFFGTNEQLREEVEFQNSQYDPDADYYFEKMLEQEALEDLGDFCELAELCVSEEVQEGEFGCIVRIWPSLDLLDEGIEEYKEVIEAENFAQVIVFLSSRYNFERFWTVTARDESGNEFS